MTKFLNISTDRTLGGATPSDSTVSSQKAIKNYIADNVPLNKATGSDSVSLFGIGSTSDYDLNIGYGSSSGGEAVALGYSATARSVSVAIGSRSGNTGNKTNYVAIGYYAIVDASNTVAIGYASKAYAQYSIAIGDTSYVQQYATYGVAIGYNSNCTGSNSVALGYNTVADAYGTALGAGANVSGVGAIQLGYGTNSEHQSLYVGFNAATAQYRVNYKLLGSTGIIPIERLGGDNTSTNAKFLKENGTWAEVGGGVSTDGISITTNSSDEIQTIGVIDQNNTTNAIKTWTGTKAQYDAIATKDANTVYNITDDANPLQALLETIYPVGSIYIGTMNICPLSALFGTWEKVSSGRVLQGADISHQAGTTIEAGLPNITYNTEDRVFGNGTVSNGALTITPVGNSTTYNSAGQYKGGKIDFDASNSNSIYGNSTTVQPPAFVVNIWQRTA